MVWIGLISYPLYLWHWPLLVGARILVNPEGSSAIDPTRAVRVTLVLAAVELAWLTYRLIEQPIRTGQRRRAKALGLVAAMLLVGLIGSLTYASGGYPRRLGATRAEFPGATRMVDDNYRSHPSYAELFREVTAIPGRDVFLTQPSTASHFKVALVGDSHAWVLYDGFSRSTQLSTAVVGRGTCAPLFNVDGLLLERGVETPLFCQPLVNNAYAHFVGDADTDVIAVAAYFGLYDRNVKLISAQSHVVLLDALRDTLTRLAQSRKKIVLVYDVPEIPRSCFRRQFPVWNQRAHGECTIPRDAYETARRGVVDVVRDVSVAYANVSAYDPASVLCTERQCGEIDPQHHFYLTDGNHLNTFGAQRLGQDFARFVEQRIAAPAHPIQ
jgi:hypothetical protein